MRMISSILAYLLTDPISAIAVIGFLHSFNLIWIIVLFLWGLTDFFISASALNISTLKNINSIYENFIYESDNYEFKEINVNKIPNINKKLFKPYVWLNNSWTWRFQSQIKKKMESKLSGEIRRLKATYDLRVRVIVATRTEPKFGTIFKSYALFRSDSFIFFHRKLNTSKLKDKYIMLHELGHCQVRTGVMEWSYIHHIPYLIITLIFVFTSLPLSFFIILGAIILAFTYLTRIMFSLKGISEFYADQFALDSLSAKEDSILIEKFIDEHAENNHILKKDLYLKMKLLNLLNYLLPNKIDKSRFLYYKKPIIGNLILVGCATIFMEEMQFEIVLLKIIFSCFIIGVIAILATSLKRMKEVEILNESIENILK